MSTASRATVASQVGSATQVAAPELALRLANVNLYYGSFRAVKDVTLDIKARAITAIIGPSGCGKSTLLRSLNRINDRTPIFRAEGTLKLGDIDICAPTTDLVEIRRRIGMVFQRPNPFPQSIFDNVAFGLKLNGRMPRQQLTEVVEQSLRGAALWDDVKDKLDQSALGLSGGQQQRLCIARALATRPEVLLMDEPASALDPISTLRIEELINDLKRQYTIVIVTHNMQQAARASDVTVMMTMDTADRAGNVVEVGDTNQIFTNPRDRQTEEYITGRFG
ncbi:MAG: phosphate ABC transporter ATP-binding protein [Herpetosiphonaceae bacterium]|nr:phosphate ABC transporter ATP-binding protein [Herpetosiphonaceae bacterium]